MACYSPWRVGQLIPYAGEFLPQDFDLSALGEIGGTGGSHGHLNGRRAHRDGDGIVMEIDVVATAVGAAQDSKHNHLRAVENGRSVNEPAANLPQLDVRVPQNMRHSVRYALIHEVAHELLETQPIP